MKKLLVIVSTLIITSNVFALECAKINGRLYPVDAQAKKLAAVLKVKTCSGKTFMAAAKKYGLGINKVDATPEMRAAYDAAAKKRLEKRLEAVGSVLGK